MRTESVCVRNSTFTRRWCLCGFFLLAGCVEDPRFVRPKVLEDASARDLAIKQHSLAVRSRRIFIDPGHGGILGDNSWDDQQREEADANLRVAKYLKEYLELAGAIVSLSREEDTHVSLADRVDMSSKKDSELFISIHHNASADKDQFYCSTWYHSRKGKKGYDPRSHDIARYIQRDLAYAMRISGGPSSFDGTMSDYALYPDVGFSVLRNLSIPCVLVECTFVTNDWERRKLKNGEFNQLEAWGIFVGLARYFADGQPEGEVSVDVSEFNEYRRFRVQIYTSEQVDENSLEVFIDSMQMRPADLRIVHGRGKTLIAVVRVERRSTGPHDIEVRARSMNGNHGVLLRRRLCFDEVCPK